MLLPPPGTPTVTINSQCQYLKFHVNRDVEQIMQQGRDILSSCNTQYFHTTDIPTQDLTFVVSLGAMSFQVNTVAYGL